MAKIQPPKGYIKATEVKNRLNISDAMIRYYVQKGKIKYLVPPGRKQGFYLEKDVERLSNEVNAFITIGNAEEETEFRAASERDLLGIVKLANSLFSSEPQDSPTIPKWRYSMLKKNPETQFTLKVGETIVGFTSIIPFKTNTNKVERLFTADRVADVEITEDDIETFESGKHVHIYIGGIGVDKNTDKDKRKHYGARVVNGLISTIVSLGKRGVIIESISAQGATITGVHLLLNFGLHEIPAKVPGKRIFTMNIQESGSPLSMRYKKALEESRTTTQI